LDATPKWETTPFKTALGRKFLPGPKGGPKGILRSPKIRLFPEGYPSERKELGARNWEA